MIVKLITYVALIELAIHILRSITLFFSQWKALSGSTIKTASQFSSMNIEPRARIYATDLES